MVARGRPATDRGCIAPTAAPATEARHGRPIIMVLHFRLHAFHNHGALYLVVCPTKFI